MNYNKYRIEDFVLDPCFKQWVLNKFHPLNVYWILWMRNHPEKLEDIKEARMILLILNPSYPDEMDDRVQSRWQEICN